MSSLRFVAPIALCLTTPALGFSPGVYADKITRSADGKFVYHLVPRGSKSGLKHLSEEAYGTFYFLAEPSNDYRQLWCRPLPNAVAPLQILISEGGRFVVGIGDYDDSRSGRIIVFRGAGEGCGNLLADLSLKTILSPSDITRIFRGSSFVDWGDNVKLESDALVLKIETGRVLKIDLATGNVTK